MKKLRIAEVTSLQESVPPKNKNGLEQGIWFLTEELIKRGHELTLFATKNSRTSANLVPVVEKGISENSLPSTFSSSSYSTLSMTRALETPDNFDIIHEHSRFPAIIFSGLKKYPPVVSTIHHSLDFEKEFWTIDGKFDENSWKSVASRINTVVLSDFQAKQYPLPVNVIYNGIPDKEWPFSEKEGDYLAFLGYISPNKGVAEAIQATLLTDKKLVIAGPIDNSEYTQKYYHERVKPFVDGQKIKYIGPLGYQEKIQFLSEAEALLVPIQWDEPFGYTTIEAMVTGTPVIAWNRASMPEIIINGKTGFLVNSVEEMSQAIQKIHTLSRSETRKHVEDNFSITKMADEYEKLFYEIVNV